MHYRTSCPRRGRESGFRRLWPEMRWMSAHLEVELHLPPIGGDLNSSRMRRSDRCISRERERVSLLAAGAIFLRPATRFDFSGKCSRRSGEKTPRIGRLLADPVNWNWMGKRWGWEMGGRERASETREICFSAGGIPRDIGQRNEKLSLSLSRLCSKIVNSN